MSLHGWKCGRRRVRHGTQPGPKGLRSLVAIACLCSIPFRAAAQDSAEALSRALLVLQQDIVRDTEALNTLRGEIDAERVPLAQRLDALRADVAEQRTELDRIQEVRTRGEREQAELRTRVEAMEEELLYLRSLFSDYGRALDTRQNPARDPVRYEAVDRARTRLEQEEDLSSSLSGLLSASMTWARNRVGGERFEGAALDDAGVEHPGTYVTLGPSAYFAAESSEGPVGLALLRFGTDQPAVYGEFSPDVLDSIRVVTEGEGAVIPVDATGGDAIRVAEATPGLVEHLKQGGFTMIPLAGVAGVALILALWKLLELSQMRVKADVNVQLVLAALREGDLEGAEEHAAKVKRPLRQLIDDVIVHREATREQLEEIMHEHVLASLPSIERNLGALAVLGGVAPLLGLLGTVTGMIHTFQLVTLFGSGDAKLLSGGISEALVTTETGLAIAIPTLLIHAFLSRRARGIVGALEVQATTLVNDLKVRGPAA